MGMVTAANFLKTPASFCSECPLFNATFDFSGDSDGKESACNSGDPALILGLGRSPGKGNGNPLQYSCLGNYGQRTEKPGGTVHGVARIRHDLTTKPPILALGGRRLSCALWAVS